MNTPQLIIMGLGLVATFGGVYLAGDGDAPAPASAAAPATIPRVDMNDAIAFLTRLQPLLHYSHDASIWIYGGLNGREVRLDVEIAGNKMKGRGSTLERAYADLLSQNDVMKAKIESVINPTGSTKP